MKVLVYKRMCYLSYEGVYEGVFGTCSRINNYIDIYCGLYLLIHFFEIVREIV